jgi:hypothetical protein
VKKRALKGERGRGEREGEEKGETETKPSKRGKGAEKIKERGRRMLDHINVSSPGAAVHTMFAETVGLSQVRSHPSPASAPKFLGLCMELRPTPSLISRTFIYACTHSWHAPHAHQTESRPESKCVVRLSDHDASPQTRNPKP